MSAPIAISTNLRDEARVPYFFWDRNVTVAELRAILADPSNPERIPLLRVLLREARPDDALLFVSPTTIAAEWERVAPGLGRQRAFWRWLLDSWRALGYLP